MEPAEAYRLCNEAVIVADGQPNAFPITSNQELIDTATSAWRQITFLVEADVGAGQEIVGFQVQVTHDAGGASWFDAWLHNLAAVANKWIQAANAFVTADTSAALFAISNCAPFVRVIVTNNGQTDATVTIWAIVAG